jgi:CheY-like chemotaxis protein
VLPGLDGWKTMEALQAMQMIEGITSFILVSGYGRERLLERSQAELDRMGGYLPKPFTASMLFDTVALSRSPANAVVRPVAVSAPKVARLKGVKVLVVEDNLMNQQVVKELLEIEGAHVQVVSNGQAAVDTLSAKETSFDAVLMDLQMPNMDGYAATRIIRKELGLHNLPVIAITANMMPDDKKASLSAGMNAHIGKPFNIDLLVRVIQKEHAVTRS